MANIVIVNGTHNWRPYFIGDEVHKIRLQNSRWFVDNERLWILTGTAVRRTSSGFIGGIRADGILWRLGAVRPHPSFRDRLEMIRMANIPCVNPVGVLLRCYDRLSMLNECREAGLPVVPFSVYSGDNLLGEVGQELPVVVKVGNYHGGYGKTLIKNEQQWQDLKDLMYITQDYITIEPYIDYIEDIRCFAVHSRLWGMKRKGKGWKANVETQEYEIIEPPPKIGDWTLRAMEHLKADVLGLDFVKTTDGEYILLECNEIPGVQGFPKEAPEAIAEFLRQKTR